MEIKRIQIEHQKINRLIWKRMVEQSRGKTPEEKSRQELFRAIEEIRNTPNNENEQGTSKTTLTEETDYHSEETTSTNSNNSMDVPAINFKKYLEATGVRYIQMGHASHVQENKKLNLEETVRHAKQKISTDLKTIAIETTNDGKLQKLWFAWNDKLPEEYKQYTKNLSTRFGVMFYDHKIIVPKNLRNTVITLLNKGQPFINMMPRRKVFRWPKMAKEVQQK